MQTKLDVADLRCEWFTQLRHAALAADSAMILQLANEVARCDDFLRKPFHESESIACLARHLDVEFRYHQAASIGASAAGQQAPARFDLDSISVERPPADWVEQVYAAAVAADMDRLQALAAQIKQDQPALSNALHACLDTYDYSTILAMARRFAQTGHAKAQDFSGGTDVLQ